MGIALDIFRKLQYEKGFKEGLAIARSENRAELDYLRKRLAELERINGISPDESRASDDDGSQE